MIGRWMIMFCILCKDWRCFGAGVKCQSTGKCSCDLTDGSGSFDLSAVDSGPKSVYQTTLKQGPGMTVVFNPCEQFSEGCTSARVCLQASKENYVNIGTAITYDYKEESKEAEFIYKSVFQGTVFTTIITLRCFSDMAGPGQLQPMKADTGANVYYGTLDSRYACLTPKPHSSKLSTGSILCIVLLVTIVLYVVVGILVNKYVRKIDGADVFPNKDFWKQLPGLIKAGFSFTVSKIRAATGRSSYEAIS